MKPLNTIRNIFRRRKPPAIATAALVEPAATLATPELEGEPEWKQKIRRVHELCEARKKEMQLTKGGRVIDVSPDPVVVQQREPF